MVIDEWQDNQLKHFIETLPQPIRSAENLLPLEKLCVDKRGKRVISRIYRVLIERAGHTAIHREVGKGIGNTG